MSRPQFVLVAGPNGAGKSTLTRSIRRRFPNLEVIDPDAIARGLTGSYANVDQEQLAAGRRAVAMVRQCIDDQRAFLAESTISGTGSTYLRYVQAARDAGFRTVFIYIALESAELSAQRVAQRVALGGHAIPADHIRRRYDRSMANIKPHIQAFESAHIYDNTDHYKWVAAFREGNIHRVDSNVPAWLRSHIL